MSRLSRHFRGVGASLILASISGPVVFANDPQLEIRIGIVPGLIQIDSGSTCGDADTLITLSPGWDSLFNNFLPTSVCYLFPEAGLGTGIWSSPGPSGCPKPDFTNFYRLIFESESARDSAFENFVNRADVTWIEKGPTEVTARADTTLDPQFGLQWGLRNKASNGSPNGHDIGISRAWDIYTGSPSVIVGVVGTGVNKNHPDFQTGSGTRVIGDSEYNNSSHETSVAGIIGAATNNHEGLAGIDWNARILAQDAGGLPDRTRAAYATITAVDQGAVVINHSYGDEDWNLPSAMAMAYSYNNDVVSVAAIDYGGIEQPNDWPVGLPGVIGVGSYLKDNTVSPTTNHGPILDFVAPGAWTFAATQFKIRILHNDSASGYSWGEGTSYAAPHVTGIASLMRGFNPALSNDDVEHILGLGAADLPPTGRDPFSGYGLAKADSSLSLLRLPNTVRHWGVVPSIHSVSSGQVRTINGERLFAKAYELRSAVTFPAAYYSHFDPWALGSRSTGYALAVDPATTMMAELGYDFAEFVPGTITQTGGTLRTYVYEVWDTTGAIHKGFRPCTPANAVVLYSVLGEELLISPSLTVTQPSGRHRLDWQDYNVNESSWVVDRKVLGSWQPNYKTLPVGAEYFVDSAIAYGSATYGYRVRPKNVHQSPSAHEEEFVTSLPHAPSCISAYVVHCNLYSPILDPTFCSQNESVCEGCDGLIILEEQLSMPGGEEMMQQSSGGGGTPNCHKSNMIVVEWEYPENQIGGVEGYQVVNHGPNGDEWFEFTTNLCDTICVDVNSWASINVVTKDEFGEFSFEYPTSIYLSTGSIDYCNGGGGPLERRTSPVISGDSLHDKPFAIGGNSPNPFNAGTVFSVTLSTSELWNIQVFDILGRSVRSIEGHGGPGELLIPFDGRDESGRELASGVYFWRVSTPTASGVRKMAIVK